MSLIATIIRQHLIMQRLQKGSLDFDGLNQYLAKQSTAYDEVLDVGKRTLQRDIKAISKIYNIHITYSDKLKGYTITNQGEAYNRLTDAMQMLAMVTGDNPSQYVQLETRRAIGSEHFKPLLDAIKNRKLVSLIYHKFSDLEAEPRLVEPLALKESQHRWYLIALRDGNIRTYGLDRIMELEVTPKPFNYPENWSLEEYFRNAFGVINNDDGPQEILLSFNWQQGNYVKAYPLHHSQKVVLEQDGEIQISLYMSISFDFVQEILWHLQEVEVLAPETLRQQVQTALKETLKYYVPATANT